MSYRRITIALCALAAACTPLPEGTRLPADWVPSPSFGERRPTMVVLHHTSDESVDEALQTLTDRRREVSAHYLVGRDGRVIQLVDERRRAWHAGESAWGGLADVNSASIGIELDNNGDEPFPDVQIEALIALLQDIGRRWNIAGANVVGHGDVAPARKVDPGRQFPWRRLAEAGLGLWCDAQDAAPDSVTGDDLTLLQALGYPVSDPAAAIAAFKRHFSAEGDGDAWVDSDRQRLRCLVARRRDASRR